ncbi:MAG: PEP-CTERM sorting domain-containing protein [bacterium]
MTQRMTFAGLLIAVLVLVSTTHASVMFSHSWDPDFEIISSSYESGWDENTYQAFADYYWDGSFAITDFHWWGYITQGDHSPLAGFNFQIYDNNASLNRPGGMLYEQYVAGDANAAFAGHGTEFGTAIYSYSLDLTSPFTPAAPGNYWFSVQAVAASDAFDQWGWVTGDGDPFLRDWTHSQLTVADVWAAPGGTQVIDGFAFEITGEYSNGTVPEPTTLALFGIGLVGMAVRRFRRK